MKTITIVIISLVMTLSLFSSSLAGVQEFCVADYSYPQTPAGFACKNPSKVTADDFVYSGLAVPGNTSTIIKAAINTGFADQFPGLNGQGISFARADLAVGGVVPFHYHHRAAEIVVVIEGTLRAGLVTSDNRAYVKTLRKGDIMIFPQGVPHFQLNAGKSPAMFFVGFNSENPGIEIVPYALFAGDLPTELINRSTFIDREEIRRLKAVFGGSGFTSSE